MLACIRDALVEHSSVAVIHDDVDKSISRLPLFRQVQNAKTQSMLLPAAESFYESRDDLLVGRDGTIDVGFSDRFEQKFGKDLDEEVAFSCRLILSELMQNSVDHGGAERYYIYGGVVRSSDSGQREVHLGVMDMGVSVPAKLAQKYDCDSDVEYIELALQEGVSTRRTRMGGMGLFLTFEHLKSHEGTLSIVSRYGQVIRYFRHKRVVRKTLKHPLSGTWCLARFPLRKK